jgi:hypothetical protein
MFANEEVSGWVERGVKMANLGREKGRECEGFKAVLNQIL